MVFMGPTKSHAIMFILWSK